MKIIMLKRTKEQEKFLKDKLNEFAKDNPIFFNIIKQIETKLIGNEKNSIIVVAFDDNDFLEKLLNNWTFFWKTDKKVKGSDSQCHYNSCKYYLEQKWKAEIYTWYALSEEDLLWREHTWIVENWKVLETTTIRLKYYWLKLEWKDLEYFLNSNY